MDPSNSTSLNPGTAPSASPVEQLNQLLGGFRAEWLQEHLFDLFTEPSYFPELKGMRPCILEGGRGTGKTTVLRCLSYEGQYALSGSRAELIPSWQFYGLYSRINTNRVTAFQGPELTELQWTRLFAHYLNLEMVEAVVAFLQWYNTYIPSATQLARESCDAVARALNLEGAESTRDLAARVSRARQAFEGYINNVADEDPHPKLSLQGAPVDALLDSVGRLPEFAGKHFFFLIDEYENLIDYQQRIVNTLIKHSGGAYTFKIGVRELGLRARSTLNDNEQLISPADYVRIHITEKLGDRFPSFAEHVCNRRLSRITGPSGSPMELNVEDLFGHLSDADEARRLGVEAHLDKARSELSITAPEVVEPFERMSKLSAYLCQIWARATGKDLASVVREALDDPKMWEQRLNNYGYSLLFTIRRGKRGIRKYYAGWRVLTQLAGGNIRYLLELVDTCLLLHQQKEGEFGQPVDFDVQTKAAQEVGKKNLSELEGVAINGVRLTRLLLGLGRVFQVLAADPEGHTPEANHFALRDEGGSTEPPTGTFSVDELLTSAVMHLALIRFPGNKLQDETDTKAYDYMIHPIYSAFFEFSYRRKRKIVISSSELLGLVRQPRRAIATILEQQNRIQDEPLPDQLRLFEGFYAGGV